MERNDSNYEFSRLKELGESNFKIAEGQADIRSWIVKDEREKKVGKVKDLLFDVHSSKIRYFLVDLAGNEIGFKPRTIAIPIGIAELHEVDDTVILPEISGTTLDGLPDYEEGKVNPGVENLIRFAFSETGRTDAPSTRGLTGNEDFMNEEDFYQHAHFNEQNLYQGRNPVAERTIRGIFDDGMEAENTVAQLISEGFDEASITVSGGKLSDLAESLNQDPNDSTIQRGAVITLTVSSVEEASKAEKIMDKNGAVEVYKNS
jgi:sporulation protein YlmC with PRC-barrel domain